MMMANPEVYVMSPNRTEEHSTQNVIEIIANYIEKLPEMNVKFEGDVFMIKTSMNAPLADAEQVKINFTQEMVGLGKLIIENLKTNGISNAKVNLVEVDVDPGMYRAGGVGTVGRQAVYTVQATFEVNV